MKKYFDTYKEMISLRGLTNHTVKAYSTYLKAYLTYLETIIKKKPEDVTWSDLRKFIIYIQKERSLSDRTINCCISQLRFFTLYVIHKPWDYYQIPTRKFDTKLPFVPSKKEVATFISTLDNLKVKAMICLLYSAGLRIGEVCQLKCENIDRKKMRIYIANAKNRSSRYAILSEYALKILEKYWYNCGRPCNYLFPKQSGKDKPIDTFYLSRHIHAHEEKLGWKRRLTCHTFRHAFGTHLYESGADLLTIKELLGHKCIASTTIYIQLASNGISNTTSPLDLLVRDSNV